MEGFILIVLFVVVTVVGTVLWSIMQNRKKEHTVDVTVIMKNMKVPKNVSNEIHYPYNKVTFITQTGKKLTFCVDLKAFEQINKHQRGELTFKGNLFVKFSGEGFCIVSNAKLF